MIGCAYCGELFPFLLELAENHKRRRGFGGIVALIGAPL